MYKYIKRFFDIVSSLLAIVILSPIMVITALLVRIKLGSPVLFKQERPGKDEKIFTLLKFRTMTDERDENGELLPDEVRLTNFGKFLRKTSLDELPELFNILKGDMSVIGPRPLLVPYLPYYTEREHKRHNVRPGLSGWAQVNGRNFLGWDDRLEKDVYYVENYNLLLDVRILFMTVFQVFKQENVSADADLAEPTLIEYRESKDTDGQTVSAV